MFSILDPRLWLAVALAIGLSAGGGYLKGRSDGAKHVRTEWAAAVSLANSEARHLEQERQRRVDDVARIAAARANDDRNRARHADDELERMRDTLDASERVFAGASDAAAKTAAALRADLRSCLKEYRSLGEDAAGFASDSLMYQQAWPH